MHQQRLWQHHIPGVDVDDGCVDPVTLHIWGKLGGHVVDPAGSVTVVVDDFVLVLLGLLTLSKLFK